MRYATRKTAWEWRSTSVRKASASPARALLTAAASVISIRAIRLETAESVRFIHDPARPLPHPLRRAAGVPQRLCRAARGADPGRSGAGRGGSAVARREDVVDQRADRGGRRLAHRGLHLVRAGAPLRLPDPEDAVQDFAVAGLVRARHR